MREHSKVIEAWLEGRDFQYYSKECCIWIDGSQYVNPISSPELEWRSKPEVKIASIIIPVNNRVQIDSDITAELVESKYGEKEIVVTYKVIQ